MATIRELIPINTTTVSGVTINATEAGYLQGTDSVSVTPSNCVVLNAIRDINGIRNINTTTLNVSGNIYANTITDGTASIEQGVAENLTFNTVTLNTAITGDVVDTGLIPSSSQYNLPSSSTLVSYTDYAITNAIATIPNSADGEIAGSTSHLFLRGTLNYIYIDSCISCIVENAEGATRKINITTPATVNITLTGAGGKDIDPLANPAWYYLWVIYNPDTLTQSFILSWKYGYIDFLSTLGERVPGYTYAARISSAYYNSGFREYTQRGLYVAYWHNWATTTQNRDFTWGGGTYTQTLSTFLPARRTYSSFNFTLASDTDHLLAYSQGMLESTSSAKMLDTATNCWIFSNPKKHWYSGSIVNFYRPEEFASYTPQYTYPAQFYSVTAADGYITGYTVKL